MKYIKINKDAVCEILREHFIENFEKYFEEKDIETKIQHFYLDNEMNFLCVETDDDVEIKDFEELSSKLPYTTKSVFSQSKRYKQVKTK